MKFFKKIFNKGGSGVQEYEQEPGVFAALLDHVITIVITFFALLIASSSGSLFKDFPEIISIDEEHRGVIKYFVVSSVSAIVTIYKVAKVKKKSGRALKNLKHEQKLKEEMYRKEIALKEAHYDNLEPKEKVLSPLISLLRSIFIKHENKEEICDQIITHIESTLANKDFKQPKTLTKSFMLEIPKNHWNQSVKESTEQNENDELSENSISYGDLKT